MASHRSRKSWIYRYGYRVAYRKDPTRIYFVCRYCHEHKFTDAGVTQVYETTRSTSAAQRYLGERRRGYGYQPPSKSTQSISPSVLHQILTGNRVSQTVANELSGFNIQRFRLAAVGWLVEANLPLSTFESLAFRQLISTVNPQAEAALWASYNSVTAYVLRLYDYIKPRVVKDLLHA